MTRYIQCEEFRCHVNAVLSWQFEGCTFFAHKIPGNASGLYQVSELRTGRRAGPFSATTAREMKVMWLSHFSEFTKDPVRAARFHSVIDSVTVNVMDLPEAKE